jgi:hypothetical protein
MSSGASPVERAFTILDDGQPTAVAARLEGGRVRVEAGGVQAALGWSVRPQGLCRGDTCIPVPPGSPLVGDGGGIDLAELARLAGRPLALDLDERVAYLGRSAEARATQLATLDAPDFALPDLDGRVHRLSDHRGRKVFLIAYASW